MNMIFKTVLAVLKKILLSLLGEKLVAYMTFSFLEFLAERTDTNIDNKIVKEWKDAYYGEAEGEGKAV